LLWQSVTTLAVTCIAIDVLMTDSKKEIVHRNDNAYRVWASD